MAALSTSVATLLAPQEAAATPRGRLAFRSARDDECETKRFRFFFVCFFSFVKFYLDLDLDLEEETPPPPPLFFLSRSVSRALFSLISFFFFYRS
jgi:hypothetical protein